MRRTLLLMLVALAACGDAPDLAAGAAQLTIVVDDGEGSQREATLTCADERSGSGTAWLSEQAAADEACAVVTGGSQRLIDGPPADQICTEIYGGPQTATVTGVLGSETIEASFDRTNGCGISDWQAFEALLGPPPEPRMIEGG